MATAPVPAEHPPIFNDPYFTVAVTLGWLVMVAGAAILLLTAIRYARVYSTGGPPASGSSGLWARRCSWGGLIWQLIGYFVTGVVWWTE